MTLWSVGRLTNEDLCTFHAESTRLSAPAAELVEGNPLCHRKPWPWPADRRRHRLGQGVAGQPGRVFCLISDGELQEGSIWEALIFIKQRRLAPLTILIDANGLQGFGTTKEVSGLELTVSKFREFGLDAEEIDGHDIAAIRRACTTHTDFPKVVIARTRKGHGVSFMEDRMEWHYLPMSAEQYQQAIQDTQKR